MPDSRGTIATTSARPIRLPRVNNFSFSLMKRVNLAEKKSLELQGDLYNALDHTQFISVGTNFSTATFWSDCRCSVVARDAVRDQVQMVKMTCTRRHLGKIALAALPGGKLLAKPNSRYGGVQIGIILSPTALRDIPIGADEVLKNLVELGIGGIEMQDVRVEKYAGAPPALQGAGRTPLTAEQQEARHKADAEIKTWRLSASMDRYKALRRKYADSYSQFLPDHCPAMLTWELQLPRNPIEDLPPPQLACQFNSTTSGRVVDALFTHLGNDRAATEFVHSTNQTANSA